MASCDGRVTRMGIGAALITVGLGVLSSPVGLAIAGLSLVPITAGVFNLCPVAPIWGGHFFGANYCPARTPTTGRRAVDNPGRDA
jgi:Zn-dependent protease